MKTQAAHDPTSFYDVDGPPALPIADRAEDMPAPSIGEAWSAGWRVAKDDWPGQSNDELFGAYGPVITALTAETGKGSSAYVWVGHSSGGVNERAIFADLAKVRAKRPDFLPDIPDTPDAFRASVTKRTKERRVQDMRTLESSEGMGTVAGYAGGFAGAAVDPINLMTLPAGGGGATIARRVLGEAAVNIATEAVEQPMIAAERAKRGETLTTGEAVTNVAVAGVAGAVIQGGIVEPVSAFLKRRREGKLTPTEKAAVNVVEREAEVDATSPFKPGAGTEAHRERLAEAERVLDGEQAPRKAPPVAPELSREAVKSRIRRAESGGNDAAQAATSSAYGRYQFVSRTWLRYYKRRYGAQGLNDAQILAKRSDGQIQETLMDDLLADNERALASIGARATPGNLYLAHFAGAGGAKAILRAAPDTPVSRLLGKQAVKANPFLRSMTADDLIRWAHRKVGGDPDGPSLRRDQFASDEEWAAAQREVDAAEAALANVRAREDGQLEMALSTRSPIDDAEPQMFDLWPGGDDVDTIRLFRVETGEPAKGRKAASRAYIEDEAVARAAAGEAGAVYTVDVPASRIDELAPMRSGQRRIANDVADAIEERAPARERAKATVAPDAVDDWIVSRHMVAERGPSGYRVEQADDGSFATVVLRGHDGRAKAGLLVPTHPEALENFGGVISYVSPEIRRKGVATRMYNIAREAGLPIERLSGHGDLTPDGAAFVSAWRERSAPLRAEGAERFDDGIRGDGARALSESLEHDLRMVAAENPDELVRINDEGGDMRLADVLDDLDADDAALVAVRACMAPMRGA